MYVIMAVRKRFDSNFCKVFFMNWAFVASSLGLTRRKF